MEGQRPDGSSTSHDSAKGKRARWIVIAAAVDGFLKNCYAYISVHVKNGRLLAEIDTPEVDDQLRATRSDFAGANG